MNVMFSVLPPLSARPSDRIVLRLFCILSMVVLVLAGSACSGGGSDDNDEQATLDGNSCDVLGLNPRIVNGTECSNAGSSPIVRIELVGIFGPAFCTGIMITPTDVLTAGHCFLSAPTRVSILVGDSLSDATRVRAIDWDVHPGFREGDRLLENDAAVIHLEANPGLPTLPLLVRASVARGSLISIFGYGTDENGIFDGNDLVSGDMIVADVTTTHIQADFNGEGSNTCTGDSGGPLIFQVDGTSAVQGLTSSGAITECTPGDNSFFTNIQNPSVLTFLQDVAPNARYF